mmetsp:Transcript_44684/g.89654  ORF Transcript_44684/g.89654 Transcript_44684/m.89654 type:complete len:141 (+) Transcript_44684:66-488(+)
MHFNTVQTENPVDISSAVLFSVFNSSESDDDPPLLHQHVQCSGPCEAARTHRELFPCSFDDASQTASPFLPRRTLLGLHWTAVALLLISCCPCCFLVGVVTLVSAVRETSFSLLPHKWSCENPLEGHVTADDEASELKEV